MQGLIGHQPASALDIPNAAGNPMHSFIVDRIRWHSNFQPAIGACNCNHHTTVIAFPGSFARNSAEIGF